MPLHYNVACPHGDRPTTPLRLMCNQRRYADALAEIARLDTLQLDVLQQQVVRAHEALVLHKMRRISYAQMFQRLTEVSERLNVIGDNEMTADFRCMCIGLASRGGDRARASHLISRFFDGIERTTSTEALWRIAQGLNEQPREAIRHFVTVATQLQDQNCPCLLEGAVRRLAYCLYTIGDQEEAVQVLRRQGFPASLAPGEGEIPLADFFVLPLL